MLLALEQLLLKFAEDLGVSPYAIVAAITLVVAIIIFAVVYPLIRRKPMEKEKEKKLPKVDPVSFLIWVKENFESLEDFEQWYWNVVEKNRKRIRKELYP